MEEIEQLLVDIIKNELERYEINKTVPNSEVLDTIDRIIAIKRLD